MLQGAPGLVEFGLWKPSSAFGVRHLGQGFLDDAFKTLDMILALKSQGPSRYY